MQQLSFDDVEFWRPVVGYEGRYEVSSHGRVRSLPAWRTRAGGLRKPTLSSSTGYLSVALRAEANGRQKRRTVHTLVAEAFLGPRPAGCLTRHLDGTRANNRLDNLAWGTPRENSLDQTAHGRNHNANKTHCVNGHEFTPENTYWRKQKYGRDCMKCLAAARERRRQRLRAMKEAA